jgi:hypothetical protein
MGTGWAGNEVRRSARIRATAAAWILLVLAAGCAGGKDASPTLRVERDTVGDTLVVRTVAGSVWGADASLVPEVSIGELEGDLEYLMGEVQSIAVGADGTIYVLDAQGPELRAYGPDGRFLRRLGRPGEGPGELKAPGAIAILSDQRLVVRDPGNGRIQVYGPDGAPAAAWTVVRGSFRTSGPLPVDRRDNMYIMVLRDMEADVRDWKAAFASIGPDGVPGDTLDVPDSGFEPPRLEARSANSVSVNSVPFTPAEETMLHPDGYFVHGISSDYRFTLLRPGAPLRVEKAWKPVPVEPGEKEEAELRITRNMRRIDPAWKWSGPAIPDTKRAYENLFAGRDGRIWVEVAARSVKVEDTGYDPTDPNALPDEWRERSVLDVFEDDGTYLGRVVPPEGFRTDPQPVFDGDHVWAVSSDDLGVQRVVRYRVTLPDPQG